MFDGGGGAGVDEGGTGLLKGGVGVEEEAFLPAGDGDGGRSRVLALKELAGRGGTAGGVAEARTAPPGRTGRRVELRERGGSDTGAWMAVS